MMEECTTVQVLVLKRYDWVPHICTSHVALSIKSDVCVLCVKLIQIKCAFKDNLVKDTFIGRHKGRKM